MNMNTLKVAPETSNEPTQNNLQPVECRICLETGEAGLELISPCQCKGTTQYVHETCLIEWIERKESKGKSEATCEICHSSIRFKSHVRLHCRNCR